MNRLCKAEHEIGVAFGCRHIVFAGHYSTPGPSVVTFDFYCLPIHFGRRVPNSTHDPHSEEQKLSTSSATRSGSSTQCQCPHASSTFRSFFDDPACSWIYLQPSRGADLSSSPAKMQTGAWMAEKSGSSASMIAWQCEAYPFGSEPMISSRMKAFVKAEALEPVAACGIVFAIGSMPSLWMG